MAPRSSRVRLDLNSPQFQDDFFAMAAADLKQVVSALRLSRKVRAIGYRDGDFLRLISLHPDHDSAYS